MTIRKTVSEVVKDYHFLKEVTNNLVKKELELINIKRLFDQGIIDKNEHVRLQRRVLDSMVGEENH